MVKALLDGPSETLVLLWVIVLQCDLQLHRFGELAFLRLGGILQDIVNGFTQRVSVDLTGKQHLINNNYGARVISNIAYSPKNQILGM